MIFRSDKRAADELEYARLLAEETLILDTTEEICRLLDEQNVSRKELAEKLGKSKGFVTQLLSGERNMTLRTIADIAHALSHRFHVQATPTHLAAPEEAPTAHVRAIGHWGERLVPSWEHTVRVRVPSDMSRYSGGPSAAKVQAAEDCGITKGDEAAHEHSLVA